ncbi:putative P2Y purinoceptor 10, partial [Gracilinanus agilis]|uniref:putative P2Y purinoceptor 10 n=1 Tax=Gracilinanus agilis TaxID=191870 RepID=UPI001CFE2F73
IFKMEGNSTEVKCNDLHLPFQYPLYAITYIVIFIPGLLANGAGIWVLCRYINKKNKAIIFMINLAIADFAHVLSLPLRIYYYIRHQWPFPRSLCLLCFYLKYLNMYASICFLTCISLQRCYFLLKPFKARDWKRRYDVAISAIIWVTVGAACLPLPVMRSASLANNSSEICFADLAVQHTSMTTSIAMITVAELGGFVIPIGVITFCTWKMMKSLQDYQTPPHNNEKDKAFRMVLICAMVFFICFTPYHINFPIFMMLKQDLFSSCHFMKIILCFHIISLCIASMNCCLDPLLYYFMTAEFRDQLSRRGFVNILSRFTSKHKNFGFNRRQDELQTITFELLGDFKSF